MGLISAPLSWELRIIYQPLRENMLSLYIGKGLLMSLGFYKSLKVGMCPNIHMPQVLNIYISLFLENFQAHYLYPIAKLLLSTPSVLGSGFSSNCEPRKVSLSGHVEWDFPTLWNYRYHWAFIGVISIVQPVWVEWDSFNNHALACVSYKLLIIYGLTRSSAVLVINFWSFMVSLDRVLCIVYHKLCHQVTSLSETDLFGPLQSILSQINTCELVGYHQFSLQ